MITFFLNRLIAGSPVPEAEGKESPQDSSINYWVVDQLMG
jgi:hypothetical protein